MIRKVSGRSRFGKPRAIIPSKSAKPVTSERIAVKFAAYLSEEKKFKCFFISRKSLKGLVKAMEDFPNR
jgi:hypothetical protein